MEGRSRGRAWTFLSKVLPTTVNQRFKRPVRFSAVAGFRTKVLASKKVPMERVSLRRAFVFSCLLPRVGGGGGS